VTGDEGVAQERKLVAEAEEPIMEKARTEPVSDAADASTKCDSVETFIV